MNAMLINFSHYNTLCFHGCVYNKKIVNVNILPALFYILCTRVGKIHAHAFLIHVQSSVFMCSLHRPWTIPSDRLLSFLGYAKFVGKSCTHAFACVY
jgi:hypothetical protein